jgi:hypothetical protein
MSDTATKKPTAAERRFAAVRTLCDETREARIDGDEKPYVHWFQTIRDQKVVASRIRDLAPLGRTERWTRTVEAWASEVETSETPEHYRWAFDQYGIYACHAAD